MVPVLRYTLFFFGPEIDTMLIYRRIVFGDKVSLNSLNMYNWMYNEELLSDTLGFNWEGGNTLFLMIGTQSNKQLIQHFIIMNYITNSGMDIGQLPCTRNCNCTILCSKGKPDCTGIYKKQTYI